MYNCFLFKCARNFFYSVSSTFIFVFIAQISFGQVSNDIVLGTYVLPQGLKNYYELINNARLTKDREKVSAFYQKAIKSKYLQPDHCQSIIINELLKPQPDSACIFKMSTIIEERYPMVLGPIKYSDYWAKEYATYVKFINCIDTNIWATQRLEFYKTLMEISTSIRGKTSTRDSSAFERFKIPLSCDRLVVDSIISVVLLNDIKLNGYPKPNTNGHLVFSTFYYCCLHIFFNNSELEREYWHLQKKAIENGWISNNQYAYLIDHTFYNIKGEKFRYFALLPGVSCDIRDVSINNFSFSENLREQLCLLTLCQELSLYSENYYLNLETYCK